MVNYSLVIKGVLFFIIGTLISAIVYQLGTALLDALTSPTDQYALDTTEQGIVWLIMIVIWVFSMVIMPSYFIIEGLKGTPTKEV